MALFTSTHWGPLKTRSGCEPVPRCEPSIYQPISRCLSHWLSIMRKSNSHADLRTVEKKIRHKGGHGRWPETTINYIMIYYGHSTLVNATRQLKLHRNHYLPRAPKHSKGQPLLTCYVFSQSTCKHTPMWKNNQITPISVNFTQMSDDFHVF